MESPSSDTPPPPTMETAIERKRRLRRERILNNSESRMRRILGDKPAESATAEGNVAAHPIVDGQTAVSAIVVSPTPSTSGDAATNVDSPSVDAGLEDSKPTSAKSEAINSVTENILGTSKECHLEQNGFHPQLLDRENSDSKNPPQSCGAAAAEAEAAAKKPKTLVGGGFGFNASSLKNRKTGRQVPEGGAGCPSRGSKPEEGGNGHYSHETYDGHSWAKDSLVLEDEEELRKAQNLLLRDHHRQSSADVDGTATRNSQLPTRPLIVREPPPRTKKTAKRSSQEEVLREELERIIRHENQSKTPKPASRQGHSTRRKSVASSHWYTKAWFRISFAILLALFVRVLMQINLSDHFSDSAFYPFFSMELCFFAAAFCSKPPGYKIPIGGGIVEMVTNLLGFSREILGNLKWCYEFAFQKPVEEFSLYFFVFAVSHLILKHVQDREDLLHDEL